LFRLTKTNKDATYEWYKERVETRVDGTCEWFLNHENFQTWLKKESGLLLVSADPGCGKTVLTKYLVDHQLPQLATVCYFFFKDPDQNTVRQALCALLHQLFTQKPSLLEYATKQYRKDGPSLIDSNRSLWTVLENAVRDPKAGHIIMVLDALDECMESDFKDLMRNMGSQFTSNQSSCGKLKYLLTSRPYEQVLSKFRHFSHIHIPGEEESENITREVNLVIQHRVESLAKKKGLQDSVKDHLKNKLIEVQHRTYLWVHLVFELLEEEHFKKTQRGVEAAFTTLPKSVNQAYEQILSKSKEDTMVRRSLSFILAATRPLTISEMNIAVNMDDTVKDFKDLDLEAEKDFKLRLRSWCGLFISVHHDKIYLLHQTAREFLLVTHISSTGNLRWYHSIAAQHAHTVLAQVTILYLDLYNSDIGLQASIKKPGEGSKDAFLNYSSKNWTLHFREGCTTNDDTIVQCASKLCDPNSKAYPMWSRLYWKSRDGMIPDNGTGLMIASYFGLDAVVMLFLEHGIDPEVKDNHGRTPMSWAAETGHGSVIKLLLKTGKVNADSKDKNKRTPLSYAAGNGHECAVKALLDSGKVHAESKDDLGMTPLLYATKCTNQLNIKQMMTLILNELSDQITITEEVVKTAAANYMNGKEVMALLLEQRGDQVTITEEVVKAAAANSFQGKEVMALLLEQRGDQVTITEEVVKAVAANSFQGKEVMALLLKKRGDQITITEELTCTIANELDNEVMALFLNQRGDQVTITEEVVKAAAANVMNGKEMMTLLLEQRGDQVTISEEVVQAAATNYLTGKEVMKLLLDQRGDQVTITEELTCTIANKFDNEVMALFLNQHGRQITITKEVTMAAATNYLNGKEVMALLLEQFGNQITITEEVAKAAAANETQVNKVLKCLLISVERRLYHSFRKR
jgi:hypothetical protein